MEKVSQHNPATLGKSITRLNNHTEWEHRRMKKCVCTKCNEKLSPKSSRFCEKHRIASNKLSAGYQKRNKEICSHRTKISGHRARVRVMAMLGGLKCSWCGEDDYRLLTIDHIDGHKKPIKQRVKRRNSLVSNQDSPLPSMRGRGFLAAIYAADRGELDRSQLRVLCCNCQVRNEYRRGNRKVYDEVREAVIAAGGRIGNDEL